MRSRAPRHDLDVPRVGRPAPRPGSPRRDDLRWNRRPRASPRGVVPRRRWRAVGPRAAERVGSRMRRHHRSPYTAALRPSRRGRCPRARRRQGGRSIGVGSVSSRDIAWLPLGEGSYLASNGLANARRHRAQNRSPSLAVVRRCRRSGSVPAVRHPPPGPGGSVRRAARAAARHGSCGVQGVMNAYIAAACTNARGNRRAESEMKRERKSFGLRVTSHAGHRRGSRLRRRPLGRHCARG